MGRSDNFFISAIPGHGFRVPDMHIEGNLRNSKNMKKIGKGDKAGEIFTFDIRLKNFQQHR